MILKKMTLYVVYSLNQVTLIITKIEKSNIRNEGFNKTQMLHRFCFIDSFHPN